MGFGNVIWLGCNVANDALNETIMRHIGSEMRDMSAIIADIVPL